MNKREKGEKGESKSKSDQSCFSKYPGLKSRAFCDGERGGGSGWGQSWSKKRGFLKISIKNFPTGLPVEDEQIQAVSVNKIGKKTPTF